MTISSETLKSAVLKDPCFAELVEVLIGPFSAYAIVPANMPEYIFEGRGRFSEFCSAIRSKDDGHSCMECDLRKGQSAAQAGRAIVYLCHAGLVDLASPIILDSQHIATIFCGQRRPGRREQESEARSRAEEVEKHLGFETGSLLTLWEKVEPLDEKEAGQVCRRLDILSRYVAQSLERIEHLERAQRHSERLFAALNAIASMHATTDRQKLFETIVLGTAEGLTLNVCGLAVREPPHERWEIRESIEKEWLGLCVVPCPDCGDALAKFDAGEVVWIPPDGHCLFHGLSLQTAQGLVLVPIPPRPKAHGMLILGFDTPWDSIDQRQRALVETLSINAGLSLNNLILTDRVEALTGQAFSFASGALGQALATPLAHEVWNGLQNIGGAAKRLEIGLKLSPGSQEKGLVNRLGEESERLTRLIKSMLDVTKRIVPEKRWFYLNDIIDDAAELARVVARKDFKEKRIELQLSLCQQLDRPLDVTTEQIMDYNHAYLAKDERRLRALSLPSHPVLADPDQMKQVIVNLLVNAMKASEEGRKQPILIATELWHDGGRETGEERVVIKVTDYGCGFSAEALARMFKPGYTTTGGAGLGLFLVKSIVEGEHGGSVDARSAGAGSGASFQITIPRVPHG